MPIDNPLFWQSLSFSTTGIAIVVISTWWLFLSVVRSPTGVAPPPSGRLAAWLAALLSLSALQFVIGAFWDSSMHIQTGRVPSGADFLWPPHLMIYGSFLISFLVAATTIAIVAVPGWRAGERDPRLWVRRSPHLGAVALASLYSLLAIPGDALWHALYGLDLTAWSPPHVMIAAMMCAVMVCAAGLVLRARPPRAGWHWSDAAVPVLLGMMLNVAMIVGTIEWEIPVEHSSAVAARPVWYYPLVGGTLAFAALLLSRGLSRYRWAATATAAVFFVVRLGIMLGLDLTGNIVPYIPPVFILGALLIDLTPWERIGSPLLRSLTVAAAFTSGYALFGLPVLSVRAGLPRFSGADIVRAVASTLLLSALLVPAMRLASAHLLGHSPHTP